MPDEELFYYEFKAAHGRDQDGNLEPLADIGLSIPAPQAVGKDILPTAAHIVNIGPAGRLSADTPARVIPDTRIIETREIRIATALQATALFDRIDPPTKTKIADAEKETRAHMAGVKRFEKAVEAGDVPAPDATDQPQVPVGTPMDPSEVASTE